MKKLLSTFTVWLSLLFLFGMGFNFVYANDINDIPDQSLPVGVFSKPVIAEYGLAYMYVVSGYGYIHYDVCISSLSSGGGCNPYTACSGGSSLVLQGSDDGGQTYYSGIPTSTSFNPYPGTSNWFELRRYRAYCTNGVNRSDVSYFFLRPANYFAGWQGDCSWGMSGGAWYETCPVFYPNFSYTAGTISTLSTTRSGSVSINTQSNFGTPYGGVISIDSGTGTGMTAGSYTLDTTTLTNTGHTIVVTNPYWGLTAGEIDFNVYNEPVSDVNILFDKNITQIVNNDTGQGTYTNGSSVPGDLTQYLSGTTSVQVLDISKLNGLANAQSTISLSYVSGLNSFLVKVGNFLVGVQRH